MLLRTDRKFRIPKTQMHRVLALEETLRQSSSGQISISAYAKVLEQNRIPVVSQRSLHEDFVFYSSVCDDLIYGSKRKKIEINEDSSRDALSFFFGNLLEEVTFSPRMYSSTVRCLALACELRRWVNITYTPFLERGDIVFGSAPRLLMPLRLFRGADTGYLIAYDSKTKMNLTLNLSRIERSVAFVKDLPDTNLLTFEKARDIQEVRDSRSEQVSQRYRIVIEAKDLRILRFALLQFPHLKKYSRNTAILEVSEEYLQLAFDTMVGFFDRLERRKGDVRSYSGNTCRIITLPVESE